MDLIPSHTQNLASTSPTKGWTCLCTEVREITESMVERVNNVLVLASALVRRMDEPAAPDPEIEFHEQPVGGRTIWRV